MKQLLFLLLTFMSYLTQAQGTVVLKEKPFISDRRPDSSVYHNLAKDPSFEGLQKNEQVFLYWVNMFRKNPGSFRTKYIVPFLDQFPEANSSEAKDLLRQLDNLQPLPQLSLSPVFTRTAKEHANYLAGRKQISHTGKGGKSFPQRMKEAGIEGCGAENIFDGQDDALMALILLLIDTGVPGTGHRDALMNPQFKTTGVGTANMDPTRVVFVQQFGCN